MDNLSFLAHDIRNIAAAILLDAERMSTSANKPEQEMGLRTLQRIERMVTICETAMISAHQVDQYANHAPTQKFRLSELLFNLVASLPRPIKPVDINLDCDAEITTVLCENKLYRLLYNLMTNATKALEKQDNGALYVSAECKGEYIQIDICDNGSGLPETVISRFFGSLPTTREKNSVHGYGLTIAKRMADELYGCLALVKSNKYGTHFRVTLPC